MKQFFGLVLACLSLQAFGQGVTLSSKAELSLITCGPGQEEVYTAFGHSAIRVRDRTNNIDYIYNYGVFDFSQPNFYLNYTRGLLMFKLGVNFYTDFVDSYIYHNRWVKEQVLDLSQNQKQRIFDFLEVNALPDNESYRYDYFYNNCSNKVRDVFAEVLKDSIQFDGSFITTDYTIRQLTDLYLKEQPWGDLGIDICLGLPIDKKATHYEYMYLPDYLEAYFDHTRITRNGVTVPIVKLKNPVFLALPEAAPKSLVHPWVAFGGFLFATMTLCFFDWRRRKISKWFDLFLFGILGITGILLLLLWTMTDHQAAANNFNLLWALPTHPLILLVYAKRSAFFLKKYFLGVAILTSVLLLCWFVVPQQLNIFLLPLVAAIACRAWLLSRLLNIPA